MFKWFKKHHEKKKELNQKEVEKNLVSYQESIIFPHNFRLSNTTKIQKYLEIYFNEEKQCYEASMDSLRQLYKKDRDLFDTTVFEIYLRGGRFNLQQPNPNLFPNLEYGNDIVTHLPKNQEAYQKINYSLINIKQRMDKLDITDNTFYRGIYLDGFKYLKLSTSEYQILKDELYNQGFYTDISYQLSHKVEERTVSLSIEDNPVNKEVIKDESCSDSQELQSDNQLDITTLSINEIAQLMAKIVSASSDISVEQWIYGLPDSLNVVKRFLYGQYRDYTLHQLSVHDWKQVLSAKGVGKKKRELLWEALVTEDIKGEIDEMLDIPVESMNPLDIQQLLKHYPILKDIKIQVLIDSLPVNQQSIKRLLLSIKDETFNQITVNQWNQVIHGKGIGKSKLSILEETLLQIATQYTNDTKLMFKGLTRYIQQSFLLEIWQLNKEDLEEDEKLRAALASHCNIDSEIKDITIEQIVEGLNLSINSAFEDKYSEIKLLPLNEFKTNILSSEHIHHEWALLCLTFTGLYQLLKMPFNQHTLFEQIHLSSKEWQVLSERMTGKTLEEVGTILKVTRERVRQIEKNAKKKVIQRLNDYHLLEMLDLILEQKYILHIQDKDNLMGYCTTLKDNYHQFKNYIMFQKQWDCINQWQENMKAIIEEKSYCSQEEYQKLLCDYQMMYIEQDTSFKHDILEYFGFIEHQGNVLWKKSPLKHHCAYIVMQYFPEGIYLSNETQLKEFLHHYDELFSPHTFFNWDENIEDLARRVEGNMDRSILTKIEGRTYQYHSIQLPDTFMEQVKAYIDHMLSIVPVVYSSKLKKVFKEQLAQYGAGKFILYDTLKKRYPDDYIYSSGSRTMRVFNKNATELTTVEIFETIIEQQGGCVDAEWIQEILGIEAYTIEQVLGSDNNIVRVNQQLMLCSDLSEDLSDLLNHYIQLNLENYGAVVAQDIFSILSLEHPEMIQKHQITANNMVDYLKQANPQLKGYKQLLMKSDAKITLFEYLRRYFGLCDIYQWDKIKDRQKVMGYSDTTISSNIKEAIDKLEICRIDDETFVYADQVILSEQQQNKLKEVIAEWQSDKEWLSIGMLSRRQLRRLKMDLEVDFEFPLTSDVLRFLLMKYLDFKHLGAKGITMTIDPYIMTTSHELTLKMIVQHALNQYEGPWTSEAITHYLSNQQIIKQPKALKIPEYICELVGLKVDPYTQQVTYHE